MTLDGTLEQLAAAADPSRLRLLAVLAGGEAAVAELCAVLGQSQPRVSRHLRLLADAGLVEHFREGRRVYYRLTPGAGGRGLGTCLEQLRVAHDPVIEADRARMTALRRQRERDALRAATPALLRAAPARATDEREQLKDALADALDLGGGESLGDVLDVGAGSGTVLGLVAPHARSAVGLDSSAPMRDLARSRLHAGGFSRCTVRDGDMHRLPFADARFDVVILDEVLQLSPRPAAVVAEAVRVLKAPGRVVVLDRVLPVARHLPAGAGGGLHENQLKALLAAAGLRVTRRRWLPGRTPDRAVITAATESPLAPAATAGVS